MDKTLKIERFQFNTLSDAYKGTIAELLSSAWANTTQETIHLPQMDAVSFCATLEGRLIGYAAVLGWDVVINDSIFKTCGLSCICTHPQHRGNGIGTVLIKEASRWIEQSNRYDIGLFTCNPQNSHFYEQIGVWERSPNLILRGNDKETALASDALGLDVFRWLISSKAKQQSDKFENTTIVLGFPDGEFI